MGDRLENGLSNVNPHFPADNHICFIDSIGGHLVVLDHVGFFCPRLMNPTHNCYRSNG